ncbi:MAG TPA: heparan-alpha-glucosaminide N-acetyltransferase domain-containing protein [Gammaproteobacteria bacterium]
MATQPAAAMTTTAPQAAASAVAKTTRVAAIDWMRGLVMVLMVIDHASMAFDGSHLDEDSAMYPGAATMALPAGEFLTRWLTHLCAPTFVFLAGVALALSVERRVAKGVNAWEIDKGILTRGAIIALLDPTIISLGSGRWTLQVLLAIGLSMICMVPLRRLPSWLLLTFGLGWIGLGEFPTDWVWDPPGASSPVAALFIGTYGADNLVIKYPLIPWLSMMVLGWALGRHMVEFGAGKARVSPQAVLWIAGVVMLAVFVAVRASQGYGDMFLPRTDGSWQQWLHVSKYPPSLTYATLELGLLSLSLAFLMAIEPYIGVRRNGVFLVFGQTAMFFYLAHRLAFEVPATYVGLRGTGDLVTAYAVALAMLALLYPACRWYRSFKSAHPTSFLKYL